MNEPQEVRATGNMPGLELIVNSIKSLRFKCLKLSTYNSLKNQLKLKDTIIKGINESKLLSINEFQLIINKQKKRIENLFSVNESLETQIKTLNEMLVLLQERNTTQSNTIREIHNERARMIKELEKYKGKRNSKGQFIKK